MGKMKQLIALLEMMPYQFKEQLLAHCDMSTSHLERDAINHPEGALKGVTEFFTKMAKSCTEDMDVTFIDKRIFCNLLKVVELRPSQVHDRGVFATRNIQKNELITFYPGDAVIKTTVDSNLYGMSMIPNNFDMLLYKSEFLVNYQFDVTTEYSIVGNPNKVDDTSYLGHMINDVAKLENKDDLPRYAKEVNAGCNAQAIYISEYHIAIVAHRDIIKDEEIFMPYGPEYWLRHVEKT